MAQDREGPFTWDAQSAWNGAVEDEGPGGREHWVFAAETITNADGLDVSEEFAVENPYGPFYFDFQGPEAGGITIKGEAVVGGTHYSGGAANAFGLASMTDAGAGVDAMSRTIAVGDCSNAANLPRNPVTRQPNRNTTPFAPIAGYENVSGVGDLAEDDAARAGRGQTDNNGVDCYVAELTALADELGNQWSGGADPATWMQTPVFGVDKTAAVLSDIEPETGLVFGALPEMEFEVDNPDLASGDDGTPLTGKVTRRVSRTVTEEVGTVTFGGRNGRDGTVSLGGTETTYFEKDGAKTVTVAISDGAEPANVAGYQLAFGLDRTSPALSISKSQSNIGQTGASSVTVSVGGSISDQSEIADATLRLLLGNDATECAAVTDTLPDNRTEGDKVYLDNGTNSITFDETFVIKAPDASETGTGPETYCFRLDVEDVSLMASARDDDGNAATYNLGNFTVTWPSGPPAPPPGPTFMFQTADDNTGPTTFTDADSIRVAEGTAAATQHGLLGPAGERHNGTNGGRAPRGDGQCAGRADRDSHVREPHVGNGQCVGDGRDRARSEPDVRTAHGEPHGDGIRGSDVPGARARRRLLALRERGVRDRGCGQRHGDHHGHRGHRAHGRGRDGASGRREPNRRRSGR